MCGRAAGDRGERERVKETEELPNLVCHSARRGVPMLASVIRPCLARPRAVVALLLPFVGVDVPQEYLRADIARRYNELFALGWLGRAYLLSPPLVQRILPSVFQFEPYDGAAACVERGGCLEITLKESSVVGRGIPFRIRMDMKDESVALLGIGCDVSSTAREAAGPAASTAPGDGAQLITAGVLCEQINGDRRTKRRVVRAIASTIFRRLSPVKRATKRGEMLEACEAATSFVPERQQWGLEGTSEKWLQQVSGYWFAEATLQDVRFVTEAEASDTRFTFYYDAEEPINSDDPRRNVNPEVIYCAFD